MKNNLLLILAFLAATLLPLQAQVTEKDDFYNTDKIRQIKINFQSDNWRQKLDSLRKNNEGYLIGNVTVDGTTYPNAGVKYRGGRSFRTGASRNPMHIKLNLINKEQNHEGYYSLKLSSALRDPSMIREVLGFEIAREYMSAPKANFAQVFINDEYYGLLVNIENVDNYFLEKHFGDNSGTFFKCSPDLDSEANEGCKKNIYAALIYEPDPACYFNRYELESDNGWDDLIHLTKVLAEEPENIEKVLNVDQTLWMLAYNNVLVNLSSYTGRQSQNYFLYKDSSGRFNPIIWDLNLAFGSYKSAEVGSDYRLKQLQELDPLLHIDNEYKPLISQLLQNEWWKKIYLSHLRTILYRHFEDDQYKKRAKELQQLIQVAFINDPGRDYTLEEFKKSLQATIGQHSRIPGIVELMEKRSKTLKKHPLLRMLPPEITDIKVKEREQYSSERITNFSISAAVNKRPKKVYLRYRFSPEQPFREMQMTDDGNNNDGEAQDGIFGIIIPANDATAIEYYIVAENTGAISFAPENYVQKRFTISLDKLN